MPPPVWPTGNAVPRSSSTAYWATLRQPIEALRPRQAMTAAPSIALQITFAPGSALVTPEAERALAPVADALNSPDLQPYRFRIEGHTDTVGDAEVNMALSEQRANRVVDYLVNKFGVDKSRVEAVGMGEDRPLVPARANVPEPRNRRVMVINLGS